MFKYVEFRACLRMFWCDTIGTVSTSLFLEQFSMYSRRVAHNHCLASVVALQRSIILRFTGHHYSCAVLSGREISVAL